MFWISKINTKKQPFSWRWLHFGRREKTLMQTTLMWAKSVKCNTKSREKVGPCREVGLFPEWSLGRLWGRGSFLSLVLVDRSCFRWWWERHPTTRGLCRQRWESVGSPKRTDLATEEVLGWARKRELFKSATAEESCLDASLDCLHFSVASEMRRHWGLPGLCLHD